MRIAIWNLERPPKLSAATRTAQLEKMASIDPDLWILSESSATSILPGYQARFSDEAHGYHEPAECAASILARWPIRQTIRTFDSSFALCVEIPETPLGPLVVYASIIPYAGYKGPDGLSKYWEEHRKSIAAHAQDWRRIRQLPQFQHHHFIAGGDFNQCLDGSGWYGNTESETKLRRAITNAGLECVTEDDFRAVHKLSRGNIDHLCISEGLQGLSRSVHPWEGTDRVRLSDHNGVLVELG